MSRISCVIVVVIYKQEPSEKEIVSFKQCLSILGKHPIVLVAPETLPLNLYENLAKKFAADMVPEIIRLPETCFLSKNAYNTLLLSAEFYKKFRSYEYMLLYQLDAFVFRDDVLQWCDKGYDYVGAPWFEGRDLADDNSKMLRYAGNGGFSLRRVSSMIRVLSTTTLEHVLKVSDIWQLYENVSFANKLARLPKMFVKRWSRINRGRMLVDDYSARGEQEDVFFSVVATKIDRGFNVAAPEIAMYFSFECQPRRLYELTGHCLPFGCHAWFKYDIEFWRPFIEKYGHRL